MSAVDGPGLRSVVFLQGCNLNCGHCHNPSTIPRDAADASWETASSLGYQLLPYSPFLSGITISGGEPTLQAAFVADFGAWMREQPQFARATLAVDSNGAASRDTWRTLLPVIDGAFISLKAGTEEGYRDIAGAAVMESVAQSLQLLYDAGKLWEVRIVVLPGVNDSQGQLLAMRELLERVAPGAPVSLVPFSPVGVRPSAAGIKPPSEEAMQEARRLYAS